LHIAPYDDGGGIGNGIIASRGRGFITPKIAQEKEIGVMPSRRDFYAG